MAWPISGLTGHEVRILDPTVMFCFKSWYNFLFVLVSDRLPYARAVLSQRVRLRCIFWRLPCAPTCAGSDVHYSVDKGEVRVHTGRYLSLPALTWGLQALRRGEILWDFLNHGLWTSSQKTKVEHFKWNMTTHQARILGCDCYLPSFFPSDCHETIMWSRTLLGVSAKRLVN